MIARRKTAEILAYCKGFQRSKHKILPKRCAFYPMNTSSYFYSDLL